MNRRKFLGIAAGTVVIGGVTYYLFSDKRNFTRADINISSPIKTIMQNDEREILYLASLAPSGHNTQPWLVKYIGAYHWIISNDKTKWLPAVDPTQRETILSIGAFLQNLEYAACSMGYSCEFTMIATTNQDENIMEVKLTKSPVPLFDITKIKSRRTVRSNYLNDILKKEDLVYLMDDKSDFIHYIPNISKEHQWLNEQTIEANRVQSYRDAAQKELAQWIRFSSKDAAQYCDGLTTASMEIEGISGWLLRNFYEEADVMKKSFREEGIDKVIQQVSKSAGWLLITSKGNSTGTLLETGKRMQRLLLKIRDRNIAIHPMTQILEEKQTTQTLNSTMGITDDIQFLLRTGYLKNYPDPVSLRRPVERFVKT